MDISVQAWEVVPEEDDIRRDPETLDFSLGVDDGVEGETTSSAECDASSFEIYENPHHGAYLNAGMSMARPETTVASFARVSEGQHPWSDSQPAVQAQEMPPGHPLAAAADLDGRQCVGLTTEPIHSLEPLEASACGAPTGLQQHRERRAMPRVPDGMIDLHLPLDTHRWACAPAPGLPNPEPGNMAARSVPLFDSGATGNLVVGPLPDSIGPTAAAPPPLAQASCSIRSVPPLPEKLPAPVPLNTHRLGVPANFRGDMPNERGRGAFAAALMSLLEQFGCAKAHVHAVRSSKAGESAEAEQHFDRWLLNRLPGCTDVLLRFVNNGFTGILGLKPFTSWRSLARCLGDSRDYLSHRHWQCLELKGGGRMASTVHPWQSYRTTAGHFDNLAKDLVEWLLWCHSKATATTTKLAVLAERRAEILGKGAPVCDSAQAINALLKVAWEAAYHDTTLVSLAGEAVKPQEAACASDSTKRKGPTEHDQSRTGRPTKRTMLAVAALAVGTCAAVVHRAAHVSFTDDVTQSNGASSSTDGMVATGFIEVGTVDAVETGVHSSRKVSFQGTFADPVIVGGIPSSSANSRGNGAVTRLRRLNLEDKAFELFLDVPRIHGRQCGGHTDEAETVSWMMVEAGTWRSSEQVIGVRHGVHGAIEAGYGLYGLCAGGPLCTTANGCDSCDMHGFGWRSVSFAIPHPDPIVLTQDQTYYGHDWVTQNLRRIDPHGFEVRQQGDGTDAAHVSELLGWVVFSNGAGWFDFRSQRSLEYQAIRTALPVASKPYTIPFEGEFHATPALFGSLQTVPRVPAPLRYSSKSVTACTVYVQAKPCDDNELHSINERAGIVAIEPGLAKLQAQRKPLSSSLRGLLEVGSITVFHVFDSHGERSEYMFQTRSPHFQNPVVFLGAPEYHADADRDDSQKQARIKSVRTIPRGKQCPRDDADGSVALLGLTCADAASLAGCSVRSDLHQAAPHQIPRNTLLVDVCPRTCNACGTTIVSFFIDSPLGLRFSHGSQATQNGHGDQGLCTHSDAANAQAFKVSWLVVEAGTWAGGSQTEGADHWSKGKMHVASSTFGICAGGPLCTAEHGCQSCSWQDGFRWSRVQFDDRTFADQPLVMSQLQTAYGSTWATLRHQSISRNGFSIQVQGDGLAVGHATERIGYMALAQGSGSLHGRPYQATLYHRVCMPGPSALSNGSRYMLTMLSCVVVLST